MTVYDSIIIGGGPAGLSAGIYLGRALRSVLVLDEGRGRTTWNQKNDNYFGFPNGIRSMELSRRGKQQAEKFGVQFLSNRARSVERQGGTGAAFRIEIDSGENEGVLEARTIIFATGVTDVWPPFPNVRRYVGKSLFWCIYCDGFRTQGKRVVVLGNSDDAATTALQLCDYTSDVVFICTDAVCRITPEKQAQLRDFGIPLHQKRIETVRGKGGQLSELCLEDDQCLPVDALFSALGQVPNSQLAAGLGVELNESGCIVVDSEQNTNVPGAFAAGDVTSLPSQQVASAVHQGAIAAMNANYYLRPAAQRSPEVAVKTA